MADGQGSEPKSLEVRVSELEDAVRDLTNALGAAQQPMASPGPPCGGVTCIAAAPPCGGVTCIAHYVTCIAHPPCGSCAPCGGAYYQRPPCGGWGPCS